MAPMLAYAAAEALSIRAIRRRRLRRHRGNSWCFLRRMLNARLMETPKHRAGFVAIVGRPNVGKSTLLNGLLGEKIAIVSPRPQTTRNRILGVKTVAETQAVFIDTPGIHRHRANMNRFMVREAVDSLAGADAVLFVTEVSSRPVRLGGDQLPEAPELGPGDLYVLEQLQQYSSDCAIIVILNKIDQLKDRRLLLPVIEAWHKRGFQTIIPTSALKADGLETVFSELARVLPEGEHLYPADMLTDRAERFLVAELIREQVFLQARQEVPFATAVEVERFDERSDKGDVFIEAAIMVERDSQKAILVGSRGSQVKEIGVRARQEIERMLGCPAHLKLTVRVSKEWTRHPELRRRFGYE